MYSPYPARANPCVDAADAESPLKESELQVLRSQYVKEQEAQHITVQTKFNYAWGLIKSEQHENQLEGVKLLTGTKNTLEWFLLMRNIQGSTWTPKGMSLLFSVGTV